VAHSAPPQRLGARFEEALTYAFQAHVRQRRKGTGVPYVAHLLGVAALVLEDGGGEDEAIAALLHDAVEDQGGRDRLADIEQHFGKDVARIVAACSDTDIVPKPPWRERKESYLEHLATASPDVVRVSLADKIYNARAILFDYRRLGEELWARFDPASDQLWYYRSLLDVYRRVSRSPLVDELARVVSELEELTGMKPEGRSGHS
jgi:(p)ppGpp synthase/HD superfamily hydrolase